MIEWKLPDDWPKVTYVIATNPRTGSWLLADSLNRTGVAGKPGEWFSRMEEQKIRKHFPDLDYESYVKFACAESCTPNGVSAVKMHRHDFDILSGKSQQPVAEILGDAQWIWLTREDKARQAISYVLARATHQWWIVKGGRRVAVNVEYDEFAIKQAEQELAYLDLAWGDWFVRNGVSPLLLNYEAHLERDYQITTRRVLDWLGVHGPVQVPPTQLVRQSNQRNEEWLARYLRS